MLQEVTSQHQDLPQASHKTHFDEIIQVHLLSNYTDEELVAFWKKAPSLVNGGRTEPSINVLSDQVLVKRVISDADFRDEVEALNRCRQLSIPVPVIHRVVAIPFADRHLLFMERIPGESLDVMFPSMSWWSTARVALQLRKYLQRLQTVTSQTTGGLVSGMVHSEWIQAVNLPIPHASPFQFSEYLNWWLIKCRPYYCKPRHELIFKPSREHVFTHQDLALRNMVLDPTQKLWIVDWEHSGFYPDYMELASFDWSAESLALLSTTWSGWWYRMRWAFFRWIAFGRRAFLGTHSNALGTVYNRSISYRVDKASFCQ